MSPSILPQRVRAVEGRDDGAAIAARLPGLAVRGVIRKRGGLTARVDDLGQPVACVVRVGPASGSGDAHAGAAAGGVVSVADGAVGSGDAGDPASGVRRIARRAGGVAHRRLLPQQTCLNLWWRRPGMLSIAIGGKKRHQTRIAPLPRIVQRSMPKAVSRIQFSARFDEHDHDTSANFVPP